MAISTIVRRATTTIPVFGSKYQLFLFIQLESVASQMSCLEELPKYETIGRSRRLLFICMIEKFFSSKNTSKYFNTPNSICFSCKQTVSSENIQFSFFFFLFLNHMAQPVTSIKSKTIQQFQKQISSKNFKNIN